MHVCVRACVSLCVCSNEPKNNAVGGLLAPGRVTHDGKVEGEVADKVRSKYLNGGSGGG